MENTKQKNRSRCVFVCRLWLRIKNQLIWRENIHYANNAEWGKTRQLINEAANRWNENKSHELIEHIINAE